VTKRSRVKTRAASETQVPGMTDRIAWTLGTGPAQHQVVARASLGRGLRAGTQIDAVVSCEGIDDVVAGLRPR